FAVLLCFALPFFFHKGCKEESNITSGEPKEQTAQVSDDTMKSGMDSLSQFSLDSMNISVENQPADTVATASQGANDNIGEPNDAFMKSGVWKLFFEPKKDHFTGFAEIYRTLFAFRYVIIIFAFILLILSLAIKFMEREARKSILLLQIFALLSLIFYSPAASNFDRLWGFWAELILLTGLIAIDYYQMKLNDTKAEPVNMVP
ncbi:MAG: hypothetical protein ACKO6I_10750, partial [Sphingomonadales bacterium]